jgi:methionyl-tRNA formyltransferase
MVAVASLARAAPIQRAILAGDAETGVTIVRRTGLDTGPMLLERVRRSVRRTRRRSARCAVQLGAALLEALDGSQPHAQATRTAAEGVSYAPKIEKSEAPIDWSASAIHLDRKIRAFNPWPVAETQFAGESLRVLRARIAEPVGAHDAPGTLLGIAEDGLRVACGEGVLAVRELQRAGKRPVSARDFANAVRLAGLRFGP